MWESLRWEVRTCASHCDHSLHSLSICILARHLHIIPKTKNTKIYTVDRATTGKTFYFCYLTYGSRTTKLDGFPIPNSHGLVGNVDWGESLAIVACEFPGLNTILWCPSWGLPKDKGKKMKLIFLASKELSWLWNLGFHFPKLDYLQWLKVHTFSIWEI